VTEVLPARARPFQGLRAGLVSRLLAAAVDIGVVALITLGVIVGWSLLFSLGTSRFSLRTPGTLSLFVLGEVLLCIYLWIGWSTTGRTVGKQVMGLRVVNYRGELMRSGPALLRSVLCVLFPLGVLWCVVSQRNSSAQDVLLRTSVIYDWNVRLPPRAATRRGPGKPPPHGRDLSE
jgi:uncharacterized RDD family membrane protein YckC